MRTLLQAALIDETRPSFIKPIVDTCRECRAWQTRGHEVRPSINIATKFLQAGECDLFFYKRNIGHHAIDRALKFSGGMEVKDRLAETLLDAYVDSWVSRYGAFEQLYSDGKLGLK